MAHEVESCSEILLIEQCNNSTPDFTTKWPISLYRTLHVNFFENCQLQQLVE